MFPTLSIRFPSAYADENQGAKPRKQPRLATGPGLVESVLGYRGRDAHVVSLNDMTNLVVNYNP